MSRATVYRRLDRLESAGVLESSMRIDLDGHHRKRYRVVVDRLQLCVESDGLIRSVVSHFRISPDCPAKYR
jgi:Fe2+ or Zn2+ uptake regulation protein